MLSLGITVLNYEYDLTINHADYLYKEVTWAKRHIFKEQKLYANYNDTVRWIALILTYISLFFLIQKNRIKCNWTNQYFNKLLRKEKI